MLNIELLDTRAAASFLGVSGALLERLRRTHEGPRFLRIGNGVRPRVRYRRADLEAWFSGRIRECGGPKGGGRQAA